MEFNKSADESDINDVLIVISKRCLDNKDYSKALLGHYNSEKLSEKVKNIIGQIIGPNIISMMPEDRIGTLVTNFVSLVEKKREEVVLKAFNRDALSQLGEHLNYLDQMSLLLSLNGEITAKQEDNKTKTISSNGDEKIQEKNMSLDNNSSPKRVK